MTFLCANALKVSHCFGSLLQKPLTSCSICAPFCIALLQNVQANAEDVQAAEAASAVAAAQAARADSLARALRKAEQTNDQLQRLKVGTAQRALVYALFFLGVRNVHVSDQSVLCL